jgi:hypothetical protein
MTQELEVLDQLLGGDLPLNVIAGLFPDREHCQRAIAKMFQAGQILILDSSGNPIAFWRFRELKAQPETWAVGTQYRLSITEAGSQLIG